MALTTLEKVKRYLRLGLDDTTEDDLISDCITDAQVFIENYCNRKFDVQTYTSEQHNIQHCIFPYNYPIKEVHEIKRIYNGTDFTSLYLSGITNFVAFPSYVELLDYKYVTMTNKLQYRDQEDSYIEITYTAGYDVPPDDLGLAAKLLATHFYQVGPILGIDNEHLSDYSVKYDKILPPTISSILNKYKKVRC